MKRFKSFVKKLSTAGIISLTLGILVLVNYIISFFPVRTDLTENKIYSLSKATKEVLGKLDDVVVVQLFISKDLPNQLLPVKQEVDNLLTEFERGSKGNLRIERIDPTKPEAEQKALSLGIPQLQFSGIEKDKLEVSQGYFGAAMSYGGKNGAIPVFDEGLNLEYEFIAAINKLTRKEIPQIGFTTGHGENEEGTKLIKELLQHDFEVNPQIASTDLEDKAGIAKLLKTLVVIGPKQEFTEEEKKTLQNFVEKGGTILFAVEGVDVSESLLVSEAQHNLFDFLSKFGITLNRDMILSASNEIANFRNGQSVFITAYPFWVKIQPEGFNQEIAPISRLETAVFPWASSLKIKAPKGVKTYKLISTVKQSYTQSGNIDLNPSQEFPSKVETGEQIVAVAADISKGKIVAIGDADFINDSFLTNNQANAALFLNLVDWLSSDGKLSEIRSRAATYRPLLVLSDSVKATVKYGNILIMPVLVGLIGGIRLWKRKQ